MLPVGTLHDFTFIVHKLSLFLFIMALTIPPSRTLLNYFLEDTNARRDAQTDIRVIKGLAHTSDILGRLADPAGANWQFLKRASARLTKVCETIRASLDTAFEKEFKAALKDAGLEDLDEKCDFGGESALFCQGAKTTRTYCSRYWPQLTMKQLRRSESATRKLGSQGEGEL